jgi:hypothetical protein
VCVLLQEMLSVSQQHPELICQIVPSPMSLKWDKTIQRLLAEGAVGDLLAVTVKSNGGPISPDRPIMWREQYEISGMNTMGMGIFYEGMRRWVGDCTMVTTMAETFVRINSHMASHTNSRLVSSSVQSPSQ